MTRLSILSALLGVWALLAPTTSVLAQAAEQSHEDARLVHATQVLEEQRATPDNRVPDWLMRRAYGVAVIPEVIKGAFVVGGRYGKGVLLVRDANDRFSGNPIFIRLVGGSFGWQLGATATDVVLIFVTPRSVENFARGKLTLGVGTSVAAGPLGREADAAAGVNAEIYAYSRSRGLYAGVSLEGMVLAFDSKANQFFYSNESVNTEMITSGKVSTQSVAARQFLAAVTTSTNDTPPPATPPPPAAQSAPAPSPAPPSASAPSSGVKTYPMEDSHPGGEPK